MEGQVDQLNSLGFNFLEELLGEVEPSRWSGSRAVFLGIDRLVAFLVLQLLMNIGW